MSISRALLLVVWASILYTACKDDNLLSNRSAVSIIEDRASISLLPLPYQVHKSDPTINLTEGIDLSQEMTKELSYHLVTFRAQMAAIGLPISHQGIRLTVHIDDQADIPSEGYDLQMKHDDISISASSKSGVYYGLQTLAQYIYAHQSDLTNVSGVNIWDEPRLPWRGLSLDVSRHWFPKRTLLEVIEGMAAVKMNVLQLHLSDDQAFRVESKTLPRLHANNPDSQYYTQQDIKEIVTYARDRMIRIVPEFDMPGHAASILAAYPQLGHKDKYKAETGYGVFPHLIDPTKESTYELLAKMFEEMAKIFPDQFVSIGGNEALINEWEKSTRIKKFMSDNGLETATQLMGYFHLKVQTILHDLGKKAIVKNEAFRLEAPNTKTLVQYDNNLNTLPIAVKNGYTTIISHGWELNHNLSLEQLYSLSIPRVQSSILEYHDDTDWRLYTYTTELNNQAIDGNLLVYGIESKDSDKISGFFSLLNRSFYFKNAVFKNGKLKFTINDQLGDMIGNIDLSEALAQGEVRYGPSSMALSLQQIGGSNMKDGVDITRLKEYTKLTDAEKAFIQGGQAALWTEWIDKDNLAANLWPRCAVVAERLWSDPSTASDPADMYRRAEHFSSYLKALGITKDDAITKYISDHQLENPDGDLTAFLNELGEVKYLSRFRFDMSHDINAPLDNIADIAHAESMYARTLTPLVQTLKSDGPTEDITSQIRVFTNRWAPIYRNLKTQFAQAPLKPVRPLAVALSDLSKIANHLMNGQALSTEEVKYYQKLKKSALSETEGVYLAPAKNLVSLIDHYLQSL